MNFRIQDFITYGKENAITREELCKLTGHSDRDVRKAIEMARKDGVMILSSSKQKGYWISEDVAEIESYIKECESRIKCVAISLIPFRRYIASIKGKRTVKVRSHIRHIV